MPLVQDQERKTIDIDKMQKASIGTAVTVLPITICNPTTSILDIIDSILARRNGRINPMKFGMMVQYARELEAVRKTITGEMFILNTQQLHSRDKLAARQSICYATL